ncbi:tRNA lysidine(34) synthetase TilS [Effusibacillus lacus]|uniref:tRNA(Ile)-lysidine synthase n=1 Tax=Effusibacillus lacus TaxID=1348429 RepID=A0A292YHX5_9BACL|nr:tRNA lysidine(34) synthetase TilS [Effusibacillus lacus]TCS74484.1 tRNA(Ile)-lysidine synthase [Effusibacillus lacus]GAX88646.1 tRNA(Ile)-lysidine synthase [Effusibacillus lacus]
MLHKVKRTIEEHGLFANGERIVVGVSGGADSVALLNILHELAKETGYGLHVAHVEHGLRGRESLADAEFVQQLCNKLGLPFHIDRPDVKSFAREHGMSTQVAARELRYRFFLKIAHKVDAPKIALAHHADDQAETVLMRILRGTSISGLAGISILRKFGHVEIARPLLYVWREEIEKFCQTANLEYRNDSSNALTDYFRNKIRLQLIPMLQSEYNENVKRTLIQLGELASEEDRYMKEQAASLLKTLIKERTDVRIAVSAEHLVRSPLALQRRAITLILYYLCGHTNEWEAKHIEQILALAQHPVPSARIHLPNGIQAWREYQLLHIGTEDRTVFPGDWQQTELMIPEMPAYAPAKPFLFEIPELAMRGSMQVKDGAITPASRWEAAFDYEEVCGRKFIIRKRRHGDVIRPYGMQGSKKIKEILMEARIPKALRDTWPIWVLGDEIVWVTGIRRGQGALVQPQTRRTLLIVVESSVQR